MQPPFGVTKLTVDGCFKGNFGMTTSGGVISMIIRVQFWLLFIFSWMSDNTLCKLMAIYKVGACCSVQLICT